MYRMALVATAAIGIAAGAAYAVPSRDGISAKADMRDRVICRRFIRTGSLVEGYRTCKTQAEWDREHHNVRQLDVSDSCSRRGEGGAGCNQ